MRVDEQEPEARFDALFREHVADIVAYCGWRTLCQADAQDAVSDVFLTAWRRLDEVPEGPDARPWLYATARRVMANQARAGRRRALLHVRLNSMPAENERATGADVEFVREALGRLKPIDQEILLLAEWEGLASRDIARVMGCSAITARGRLHRARRRFRAAFEDLAHSPRPSDSVSAGLLEPPWERAVDPANLVIPRWSSQ